MKKLRDDLHLLKLGSVNAYLIDHGDLTLIDTGYPGSADRILGYVQQIGRKPADIKHILLTHVHTDHAGSAAAIKKLTGARVYIHHDDAQMLANGQGIRPGMKGAPGFLNWLIYRLVIKNGPRSFDPLQADRLLHGQEFLPVGKGFRVFHAPGHCRGQVALIYGDLLIAADTCANAMGLGLSPVNEDEALCYATLRNLSSLSFDAAVFGHGAPILHGAAAKWKRKFG